MKTLLIALMLSSAVYAQEQVQQPDVVAPAEAPTAPGIIPAPPGGEQVAVQAPAAGQWVYTAQYGWVYIPYGDQYVQANGPNPYQFVYYPASGWVWLTAPWVLGYGPIPYWGIYGYVHFGWYGRGYGGRWFGYRVPYFGPVHFYHGGAPVVVVHHPTYHAAPVYHPAVRSAPTYHAPHHR